MHDGRLASGPYTHENASISRTMILVMLALLPATRVRHLPFGWPALNLLFLTHHAAVITEALCLNIAGKPMRPYLMDGSAMLTGWLLAMTLPPWAPWWIGVSRSACWPSLSANRYSVASDRTCSTRRWLRGLHC